MRKDMNKLLGTMAAVLLSSIVFAPAAQAYEGFNGPLGVLTSEKQALQGYTLIAPQKANTTRHARHDAPVAAFFPEDSRSEKNAVIS